MTDILLRNIKFLPTVGEKRAELLRKELGVSTFKDLVMQLPTRYIDRKTLYHISDAYHSEMPYIQIRARVVNIQFIGQGARGRLVVEIQDETGSAELVWFANINWVQKHIEPQREYIFFGKPTMYNNQLQIVHPEFEILGMTGTASSMGVQGVYRTTEKLNSSMLGSRAIAALMRMLWGQIRGSVSETMPSYLVGQLELLSREEALFHAHFPSSPEMLSRALFRLKFEELFTIQLLLLLQKRVRIDKSEGFLMSSVGEKFNKFYNEVLTFPLTGAQKRVVKEIRQDMYTGRQMNRLLQGDVGSGKTIVALLCMLIVIDNGYQATIMAPTEILANQHYESMQALCSSIGVRVELWTGSTTKKERSGLLESLLNGDVDILIGTHALIEAGVQFSNLGFVVIDEQHRFGVMQRAKLWTKNQTAPHILVMTATPIPRTLAMTLYGDLDVSVIDELPPGRKEIKTYHCFENQRLRVVGLMREQIAVGRQVYVVYPMITESEKLDIASLEQGAAALAEHFPPPHYCSVVVHGKMKQQLKDYAMETFKRGEANILISTTVIEVGVNVPNATMMVIENAERFGLSQLHQLRGRVGRGGEQSHCVLMTTFKLSSDSRKRIRAMVATTDGFELAEMDLQLRGAGDIEGTRQSGQAIEVKIANLAKDTEILTRAREVAIEILECDPNLSTPVNSLLLDAVRAIERTRNDIKIELAKIS